MKNYTIQISDEAENALQSLTSQDIGGVITSIPVDGINVQIILQAIIDLSLCSCLILIKVGVVFLS